MDGCAHVIDLGCGTGIAARRIAARPGFGGRVTGIDLSPALIAKARRLAAVEGLSARIDFAADDAHTLGLAEASADAVIAHTQFGHLTDPAAVLQEMVRPTRLDAAEGLEITAFFPNIIAAAGKADFWTSSFNGFRRLGPASGMVTEADANALADQLVAASARGASYGVCTYVTCVMRRP